MHPVVILLIGVAVVVGSVLFFRLHAFLALILAATLVTLLTPTASRERFGLGERAIEYQVEADRQQVLLQLDPDDTAIGMRYLIIHSPIGRSPAEVGELTIVGFEENRAVADWVGDPVELGDRHRIVHPLDWQAIQSAAAASLGERVAQAFGSTATKIGILIALAAIIGSCLLESGAADRIVRAALGWCGEKAAPVAFVFSGFLLGIPVFFDTVFYLMVPLGKALRVRTGGNYLLYILTIVTGASMAHSLVPPTPGPLLVANELGVDLGLMIGLGILVGLCSSTAGLLYAQFMNRRYEVPLRESGEFRLADLEKLVTRDPNALPPLLLSLIPIILPVLLIAGATLANSLGYREGLGAETLKALGNKNIALGLAAAIALLTAIRYREKSDDRPLREMIQGALASGGVIILITAAGGAFGTAMKQTGIAELLVPPSGSPIRLLVLAFLITTAVRTAQGSATVAMITAVGVLAGFANPQTLGCHPVYLALAIGCGSKPVAWMNDSGFWVICKMSGMTETEGLKFVTPMSILMGVVGLAATLVIATLLPMV